LANVAIGNFINDQNTAQKKMMDNFTKLSEAQAQESSMNAAQMTQSMNQVVAREDEKLAREESMQEKMKDREYQERYHEWTANLQKDMAKDFAVTQARVASQMNAGRDFIQRMNTNRVEFGDRIRGMRQMLHDPSMIEQWTNVPGGMDRLREMNRQLRLAEMFHEQDHQSDITGQVAQDMAKVQEQVLAGDPHADLTKLLGESPRDVMSGKDWSDEEVEELYHTGGYPPGGLYGRDPDDPALQKYRGFNPVEYMSNMAFMEDEQFFALVKHKKFRDDYLAMRLESFKDLKEEHDKITEFSTKDYDRLAPTAVEGAYYGAAGFIDEISTGRISPGSLTSSLVLKSGEFGSQDVMHNMATKLLESVYVSIAGPGSEASLKDIDALLNGEGDKGVLDTDVELYKGFNMRNVLRHIDDQLMAMTVAPEGGTPLSMKLAKTIFEMPNSPGKTELLRALAQVPGDVQRGKLLQPVVTKFGSITPKSQAQMHDGINRMFRLTKQKAMDLRDLIEDQPTMKTYQMKGGFASRYIDGAVASYMSDKPGEGELPFDARSRAISASTQGAYGEFLGQEDRAPEEEFDLEVETLKEAIKLSPFQAAGELMAGVASHPEFLAALYSGDYDLAPVTMPPVTVSNLGESQAALENYMGVSKRRRGKVEAEMRRRREARSKKTEQPEEGGQVQDQPDIQGPGR
jgi:hypothetical protein